ncbi:DUF3168 domain-containing protein [Qipengyuania flava]|nr:DUF3168 domain-containing protein [Qipengyuania flava]
MESTLRNVLIDWLRSDGELAASLNAVAEEAPSPAPAPTLAIAASAAADWSTKTARGREVRIALELLDRNDDAARTATLASRIEHRIATLPPAQSGLRVVVTQFLRSRAERRPRNLRAVLLEYRFKILEI